MQAQYNSRAIMVVGMTILGLLGAVLAGRAVAIGDVKILLFGLVASTSIAIGLALGKNYWMLIPLTFFAGGSIGVLPLPFSYKEIGIIGAFGLFLIHLAFKRQSTRASASAIDLFLWLNVAYLVSVYIRNPVGTLAMGSELVGGRPFFSLTLTLFAFIVLANARTNQKMAKAMPYILAAAVIAPSLLIMITEFYPQASRVIYPFYSGVNIEAFRLNPDGGVEDSRIYSFADIGRPLVLLLCSLYSPITLINPLHHGRVLFMFLGMLMSALSGFRNLLFGNAATMMISSLARGRGRDIFILLLVGFAGTVMLSGLQMVGAPIPISIQRSLSFIPVEWDYEAKQAAEATADWRIEMWKEAWTRKGHMRSKMFGDGFGYTMGEMLIMSDTLRGAGSFIGGSNYEMFIIKGSYHSGPLSAIKRVGFVGSALLLIFMIVAFRYCLIMIRRTTGTPFFAWTLFISIPILYLPFEYIVIFGDYTNAMTSLLFATGMLKLIENSLATLEAKQPAPTQTPETLEPTSHQKFPLPSTSRS